MLRFARVLLAVTVVAICFFAGFTLALPEIDHVVYLMLENRPYDHFFGWMKERGASSLTGKEYNEYNGVKYFVGTNATYVNPFDPNHSFEDTTREIMGNAYPARKNPAPMNGFVKQAAMSQYSPISNVMQGFTPDRATPLTTLAEEFTMCDRYYASFPGETVINRVFFHRGLSNGKVHASDLDVILGYDGDTIYDILDNSSRSWGMYFEDISDAFYLNKMRNLTTIFEHFHFFDTFKKDAAAGTLPHFSWLSPRFYHDFGKQARDMHPSHDTRYGLQLIAETYEALRNGPGWNKTMFVIFYDEHGGFYDSQPPPDNVPSTGPAVDIDPPFEFDRLGLRVPFVLISPWAKKGFVEHEPPRAHYEHTSVFNTLRDLWNITNTPISSRQAWAASYAHLLNETSPRTDCPTSVSYIHPPPEEDAINHERFMSQPPNGLHRDFYMMVEGLHGRDGSGFERFKTEYDVGVYVRAEQQKFLDAKTPIMMRGLKKNH